ncbi:MAG: METTL5 family protein [Candidatus Bathyarchaeota archaeon]|nr:METTL5 family protein [Candidatus Bathyarchaeota archaeon]
MRRKQLEVILSQIAPSPKPRLKWEGYTLDAESAAEMAYVAAWVNDDVRGKKVVDLGCGSGILAVAASLLGAGWVVGVDVDKEAVRVAGANAEKVGASVDLVIGDIGCIVGCFDTTLMNPPFGSWRRGADIRFLEKALAISDVVYSLHKRSESVRDFLRRKIPLIGGRIEEVYGMEIVIPRTYKFHRKRRYPVKVDLYTVRTARTSSGL